MTREPIEQEAMQSVTDLDEHTQASEAAIKRVGFEPLKFASAEDCLKLSTLAFEKPEDKKYLVSAMQTYAEMVNEELQEQNATMSKALVSYQTHARLKTELETLKREHGAYAVALQKAEAQRDELLEACKASEREHENLEDSAPVDAGCIECTLGTVPNDLNTGLCAHHLRTAAIKRAGDGR